ncbi:uncharacterized protein LOC131996767 [Stomoxys calcitrans]|uniref:uncharacterized protein LOC131996767 n=1 Tax=Stomoxys calcitrans TaxID=35570 RepID=UPI0027E29257|nr:uncharacterized protein LOC131996767 [Stomoxys calcitrans]
MCDDAAADAAALLIIYTCFDIEHKKQEKKKIEKKRKRKWSEEWLLERKKHSHVATLKNMEMLTPRDYKNFLRMDVDTYEELLRWVTPAIKKEDTVMRDAITPNERLSATLRFLASGQSYEDLKFLTKISAQSLGGIILETSKAIIAALKPFIKMPRNSDEWKTIANDFENRWNFNHCVGAIDGKHVNIVKPSKSGSYFYNYKKNFSIVMMALVGANYEFLMVEVGINGRCSDAGVFAQSKLKQMYDDYGLNLPAPEMLPLTEDVVPYVIVGDDAFPLLENLMKPYSRHNLTEEEIIFNYRLSRARRIVENAFGILANRFRILHTTINLCPEKASIITLACCYLHNYLCFKNSNIYLKRSENEENLNFTDLEPIAHGNSSNNAKNVRHKLSNYFNSVGAVPWQYNAS